MNTNYTCFKANNQRISLINSEFDIKLDFKKQDSNLSAIPLLNDNKLFKSYSDGLVKNQSIITNEIIWEINIADTIYEMFIIKDFLFLSNHKKIKVVNCKNGQLIKEILITANLSNAIFIQDFLIWNMFDNNKSVLLFFNIYSLKLEKEFYLNDLASFLLSDNETIIINQYPNLIKAIDLNGLNVKWELEIFDKKGNNFVNEYPFIIGENLFVSLFPDTLKKISINEGRIAWEYLSKSGINSFPSHYYFNNSIGYLSGTDFLVIDIVSGDLIKKIDLSSLKLLKKDVFSICFFSQDKIVLFSYKSGHVIEVCLNSIEVTYSFTTKKRLKTHPFIAANTVFLFDIEGNLYY